MDTGADFYIKRVRRFALDSGFPRSCATQITSTDAWARLGAQPASKARHCNTCGLTTLVDFVLRSVRDVEGLQRWQAVGSTVGPPALLLTYRLVMLAVCLGQGVLQLLQRGPVVFTFFTVW
jgi:hypothetical protein